MYRKFNRQYVYSLTLKCLLLWLMLCLTSTVLWHKAQPRASETPSPSAYTFSKILASALHARKRSGRILEFRQLPYPHGTSLMKCRAHTHTHNGRQRNSKMDTNWMRGRQAGINIHVISSSTLLHFTVVHHAVIKGLCTCRRRLFSCVFAVLQKNICSNLSSFFIFRQTWPEATPAFPVSPSKGSHLQLPQMHKCMGLFQPLCLETWI